MTGKQRHRSVSRVTSALALAAAVQAALGATATVSVTPTPVGVSPRYLGYNMGHYMPNSNVTAWVQYSNANAYRVWASPGDYEPSDDMAPYGDGVATLEQFDARKAALRANPESSTYINWSYFNARFDNVQAGRNKVVLEHILPQLQANGVDPIMQITRSESYNYVGWEGKWEQWQHFYAMAYWSAKNFDVQRFQMYNEPDQSGATISMDEWASRLRVASDAVKSAVEDVNALHGKSLTWSMSAPVTINGAQKIDTWGAAGLVVNRTDFANRPVSYDIFDTYDAHRYNSLGSSFAADQQTFDAKIPLYNQSGQNLPVTYTEFNRYNSSTFAGRSDGPDTPQIAAEFGNIFPGAMNEDVYGMYAFKFSQTLWDHDNNGSTADVPQKTGLHYTEDSGDYNIKGATRSAEVMRLVTKAFKNQRPRMGASVSASDGNYDWATSLDEGRGNYHYYSVNRGTTQSYNVTLDLSTWDVSAGQVISMQQVSADHLGSVPQLLTVPANRIVSFSQPTTSVVLLTVPRGAAQTRVDLNPSEDSRVSNSSPLLNYGTATTAQVARSATTNADDAAYLKFNLGANDKARVGRAILNVTGDNIGTNSLSSVHVYGILNDTWSELTINWQTAPNLSGASDARIANVGTDAFPVGQLSWDNAASEWGIDVTEFVRRHPDANLSFVLIREERFAGDGDAARIELKTRESATGKPKLSLFLSANPSYYWNKNANGSFSAAGNWDAGGGPNAPSAVAVLGDFITSGHSVTLDAAATVGTLSFDNLNSYKLTGTPTLNFNGGASGAINAFKGAHTIDVPVNLATPTNVYVSSQSSLTMSKPITGTAGLTKTGTGVLTLSGNHTFGPTTALTISGGVVNLNGSFGTGIGVGSGGTLAGTGSVSGAVSASGGSIAPGGVDVAGPALMLSGGLVLNAGSSLDFDFAAAASDRIDAGALTLAGAAGSIAVNLNDLGGLALGDYTLIQHTTTLSDIGALSIGDHPGSFSYALLNNPGAIVLRVSATDPGGHVTWRGSVNGTWDSNTPNWVGGPGVFANGDAVTFDDTATGTTTITVSSSGVAPGSMTFSNDSLNYSIGGGPINGTAALVKSGTGTVTLTGVNNTFTGPLQINAGTLNISSNSPIRFVSGVALAGGTLGFTGSTALTRNVAVASASAVNTNANNVTFTGTLSGSGALSKDGSGTLILQTPAPSFAGGMDINAGTVRLTAHSGSITGIGTGPVVVNEGATLRLENVQLGASGVAAPDLTLNGGSTLVATGASQIYKSGSPMIARGSTGSPVMIDVQVASPTDTLAIGTAVRQTSSGASFATINVGGLGRLVLQSGGLSATGTYAGSWNLDSGILQLGEGASGGEPMNAPGFKNGDARQGNTVTVTGGTLAGGISAAQPANVGSTPNFFRANVVMAGGALASTNGVDANFGGDFSTQTGTTSQLLVYDPVAPATARSVNLVAGAAGTLNNAASTNWAGNLIVSAGTLAAGGAFNISRDGGAISVGPGATLQVNAGATVNLGGAADVLSDGVDHVNIINNAQGVLNFTGGTKNAGTVTGGGETSVAAGAEFAAASIVQNTLNVDGQAVIRPNRGASGASYLGYLSIGSSGALDLNDNDLVVNNGDFAEVQSLVIAGFGGSTGITSGTSDGTQILALFDNALVGTDSWEGQTVAATAIVGKYTFFGDLSFDGQVTGDDYAVIDANLDSTTAPGVAWLSGDANLDGSVTGDDYTTVDANIGNGIGGPLMPSDLPVPEPQILSALALLPLLSRRRRRSGQPFSGRGIFAMNFPS